MAAEYLEIAKKTERGTRTLVRMCHNFKNIVLVKERFDDKTDLRHTKNSFIVPVNYIEPMLEYTKQNDLFHLTKTPEKSLQEESPYAHRYYGCITPIQTKKRDVKKLAKRTRKLFAGYDHDCIGIWENQLGQLEEVEQISCFWNFDQSPSEETKTPESPSLLANNFSDDVSIDETPPLSQCYAPSRRSSSYLDSKLQQHSLNSLYILYFLLFTMFKHDNFVNILKPVPNSTLIKNSF